ncbi:MAG: cation:proton antiporter [Pseudomonadota bacterium]|nr:cation:proton antiporter [Pseudomonadota bacterium]
MTFATWSALLGLLLIVIALSGSVLSRLPLSTSMLYLAFGAAISPLWLDLSTLAPIGDAPLIERVAEIGVLLSLFTSGLKMSLGLGDGRWLLPLRLALVSMLITVGLIAALGQVILGLSLGAAVLLGGMLAPTDPVLASDVQVANPEDRDRLRFALTGEAGLNDGTAYPVVLFGLALLGLHEMGGFGWAGFAGSVVWGVGGGLGIGAGLGTAVGVLVLYLRRTHKEALGLDNFLALGLIGLAYGVAGLLHGYGFLAVFAAGVALRHVEQRATSKAAPTPGPKKAEIAEAAHVDPDTSVAERVATHPKHAPAYMAHAVLSFNEQLERIAEVVAVICIGMLLWAVRWEQASWIFVGALLLLVRPLSVTLGLLGSKTTLSQRSLVSWFGIRGIGSLYYLTFATGHGLDPTLAERLGALVLGAVVVSIIVHGISVTPLMALYERRKTRSRR